MFFALIKAKPPFNKKIDEMIANIKNKKACELNVRLVGLYYLNGVYDWIVTFSTQNISDAKRYCGYLQTQYNEYVERIDLLESVFPLVKCGKPNPEINELKKFAIE